MTAGAGEQDGSGGGRRVNVVPFDPNRDWERHLVQGERGLKKTAANIALLIQHSGAWDVRFDKFRDEVIVRSCPSAGFARANVDSSLDGYHVRIAEQWLAKTHQIVCGDKMIEAGIIHAAKQRPYHSVREYLKALEWDGVRRLDTWLQAYMGCEDIPVVRAMGRMWLISAVARAMVPGTKVDNMLVILGEQGVRKTSFLETLCGLEWFQPELPDLRNKDAQILLLGSWIVCMDEMHALRSADVTELAKNYLTRRWDRYVPKYERRAVKQPRGCVFAATGNPDQFLSDPTGNRRFWCVTSTKVEIDAIARDRDQIWAEAVAMYTDGAPWWIERSDPLWQEVERINEGHTKHDEWETPLQRFLIGREYVGIDECLRELGFQEKKDWGEREQLRVSKILRKMNMRRRQIRTGSERRWVYEKSE